MFIKKSISEFEAFQIFFKTLSDEAENDYQQILSIMLRYNLINYNITKYNAPLITSSIWFAGMFVLNNLKVYQVFDNPTAGELDQRIGAYLTLLNKDHELDYIIKLVSAFEDVLLMFDHMYRVEHKSRAFPPVALLLVIVSSISNGAYFEEPTDAMKESPDFQKAISEINDISSSRQDIWEKIGKKYKIVLS